METFSSEIGKKMRSAVKAKLIELGTEGGTAAYVDDELPDYVMIMVANKRSKQQMTSDLNLFLGHKTELFVTWLHEVLQKLQEVTIPAPAAAKKRKSGQKEEVSSKKDKKAAKKEKEKAQKLVKKPNENATTAEKTIAMTENTAMVLPPTGSITDAFAVELLEKAKHNLDAVADATNQIKKGKSKKAAETTEATKNKSAQKEGNEFDIPTISEISSTTGTGNNVTSGNREKDLAELAEIQKKIYAAKRHLKELGELKDVESEDEDFLKLRDEESSDALSDINTVDNASKPDKPKPAGKEKSPIVFDREKENNNVEKSTTPRADRSRGHSPQPLSSAAIVKKVRNTTPERRTYHSSHRANERERRNERDRRESPHTQTRRPIHERLGLKPQNNETRDQRREKELYVPAHRRQEARNERVEHRAERWRSRERDTERRVDKSRDRSESRHATAAAANVRIERLEQKPEATKSDENEDDEEIVESSREAVTRQRVGSRVIVAPVKPIESSDDEAIDKNVNSIIKIKPRPPVSPSRQACKNLLLRAVAEAQRSTILAKGKTPESKSAVSQVKARLGKTINSDNGELFTKTLRERRLKRSATSSVGASTLFRRQMQHFIVKVDGELKTKRRRSNSRSQSPQPSDVDEDAYAHEELDEDNETTLQSQLKESPFYDAEELEAYNSDDATTFDNIVAEKTQFVVTLNDDNTSQKFRRRNAIKRSHTASPPPQVSSSSSSSFIRNQHNEPSSTTQSYNRSRPRELRRSDIRTRLSKRPATPLSPTRATRLKERESTNSSPSSLNTPPRIRNASGIGGPYLDVLRKAKDVKKIIIKNDTDDEELSSPIKRTPEKEHTKRATQRNSKENSNERRSTTPSTVPKITTKSLDEKSKIVEQNISLKNKHIPIKFDLEMERPKHIVESSIERDDIPREREREREHESKSREGSFERQNGDEKRRISIRKEINNKYDNIPALSSIALDSNAMRVIKPKERCKYHPNCTKQFCDFYHPTASCKAFPNCKYADKCMYSHPKCKYDIACTNLDCNFSHSGPRNPSQLQPTAPPLSSHVVPVQNYKTISATAGASSTMCKYYPNCTKVGCTFYHPKACRFGKNCINKLECNFYHHELQSSSKFKWVASAT